MFFFVFRPHFYMLLLRSTHRCVFIWRSNNFRLLRTSNLRLDVITIFSGTPRKTCVWCGRWKRRILVLEALMWLRVHHNIAGYMVRITIQNKGVCRRLEIQFRNIFWYRQTYHDPLSWAWLAWTKVSTAWPLIGGLFTLGSSCLFLI